ncbi:hypothetical protein Pint_20098 [Pistacia integerrima]|uniref:Uncharacterized protein n=1 Tax=Pistacia integerrima TaxID=434235 RepID=A0ACC0XES8_9ROSI|nr:hypothetical protein Pint_20098 [Pistacia integerrima]
MVEREAGSSSSLADGETQLEGIVIHKNNANTPTLATESVVLVSDGEKNWIESVVKGGSCKNQQEVIGQRGRWSKLEKVPGMLRGYVNGNSKLLEDLYRKVRRLAKDARECYTDRSSVAKFNDEEFTQMMVLDACYILQFIYCIVKNEPVALKIKSNMIALVQRDLFLLENQIPFKLLNELSFNKFGNETEKKTMLNKREVQDAKGITGTFDGEPAHLLDLIRTNLFDKIDLTQLPPRDRSEWFSYRSAKELKAVGIHFRPSKTNKFTDVAFQPGYLAKLELPPIYIDDSTKSMLLNMAAYESSPNGPDDFGVSSYIWLMDSLIDHAEDVKELRSKGILLNFLGSDQQVADLFNEIADNLVSHPHAYAVVRDDIEKHYQNRLKIWLAEWLHTHFTSPWTVLAFIGAVLALVLTVIQTYESVKPSNS